MPFFSVIIPAHERPDLLLEAVDSVVKQTYPDFEVLVVYNDENVLPRSTFVDPRIRTFEGRTHNRSAARNVGIKEAKGLYLCFLDDDDLFYADHLEVLVAAWDKQPQLGAVYSLAYEVRSDIVSHEPWVYRDIMHCLIYRQPFNRPLLWHHNYLPIQTVLFQRKLFLEYGGFDTELENLEDWNLWVRYSLRHEFLLVPKVTSLYRVPSVAEHAVQRQQQLDEYYAKAQAQHAKLRIELCPPEILAIAQALSRELYVSGIPTSWLRSKVLGTPVLRRFYHPIRRIWHKFRNR